MQNNVKGKRLRSAIPYGGLSEIAKRSGESQSTVSRVVNGKSRNKKVLCIVQEYLTELQLTHIQIDNSVRAILND